MNNKRREQLNNVVLKLQSLEQEISNIYDDESEYLENMPENLQSSERYEASERACDTLSDTTDDIDELIKNLQEII